MWKAGQRVAELTKKVGQVPRTGVIREVRGDVIVVEWSDGHQSSLFGGEGLTLLKKASSKQK